MQILIKQVKILSPNSPHHGEVLDLRLSGGKVVTIGKDLHTQEEDQVINIPNLHVSMGWCDMRTHIPDPGHEYKETLQSAQKAANKGGFTQVCILPNTQPALDTKESLTYVINASRSGSRLLPIAALTLGAKGEALADMIDLHHAGAVAFSDGLSPIWNSDIMLKSLIYLQQFEGLLINRPEDLLINTHGVINEGEISTQLGLKGMPSLSEHLMIMRDLELLRYVGGDAKMHFACVSSARSVALIRQAKAEGLKVTCDVSVQQLCFDESALMTFDTNLKVNPPLRSQEEIQALWQGLKDDTIDAIVTDHQPQDLESKKIEFGRAAFGMIALETAFAALNTYNQGLTMDQLIRKITEAPRALLDLPMPQMEIGEEVDLTFFDIQSESTYRKEDIISLSKNSPFVDKELKGKVHGIVAHGYTHFPSYL